MSYDPEDTQRNVERLFHDLVYRRHPATHFADASWAPAADVVVSPRGARILLELAGVPKADVRVTLQGRVLEVTGRRQAPREPAEAHYHRAEIYFGEFRRKVELPWAADPEHVEARYHDGMLEIEVVPLQTTVREGVPIEKRSP
jgi:HSP20 family protein